MLFNDNPVQTLDSIRNLTNIGENELRRHLLSLCTSKLKILKKSSKGRGIVDNDSFTFNDEFRYIDVYVDAYTHIYLDVYLCIRTFPYVYVYMNTCIFVHTFMDC
jgi:hypothetical protein